LRDALNLAAAREVEVLARDGLLEITVAPTAMHLEREGSVLTAIPDRALPELTAEAVRETPEQTRR
jgi:hypothetical protein